MTLGRLPSVAMAVFRAQPMVQLSPSSARPATSLEGSLNGCALTMESGAEAYPLAAVSSKRQILFVCKNVMPH